MFVELTDGRLRQRPAAHLPQTGTSAPVVTPTPVILVNLEGNSLPTTHRRPNSALPANRSKWPGSRAIKPALDSREGRLNAPRSPCRLRSLADVGGLLSEQAFPRRSLSGEVHTTVHQTADRQRLIRYRGSEQPARHQRDVPGPTHSRKSQL